MSLNAEKLIGKRIENFTVSYYNEYTTLYGVENKFAERINW